MMTAVCLPFIFWNSFPYRGIKRKIITRNTMKGLPTFLYDRVKGFYVAIVLLRSGVFQGYKFGGRRIEPF